MRWTAPDAKASVNRLRALLTTYWDCGGAEPPVLLIHDVGHGARLIEALARAGDGLPARVLAVSEPHVCGLDYLAAAFAYGASDIRVLTGRGSMGDRDAMLREVGLLDAILTALGYGAGRIGLLDVDDPFDLGAALRDIPHRPGASPSRFLAVGDKREITMQALNALQATAPAPADAIALPAGAPIGRVEVADGCNALPSPASPSAPLLPCATAATGRRCGLSRMTASQCGLCAATCPEHVISLVAARDVRGGGRRNPVLLREEEPALCTGCGKPFGVKSSIARVAAQLVGKHWMFSDPGVIARLGMCADCRVVAQTRHAMDPYAVSAAPQAPRGRRHLMDVRLRGFAERAPLAEALRWLDAVPWDRTQLVPTSAALGRVLAEPVVAAMDLPAHETAFANGHAVRAGATEGASLYNPLPCVLIPVVSGDPMRAGTDAVLPFEAVDEAGLVVAPATAGDFVLRHGEQGRAGTMLLAAGQRLRPQDVALLTAFGIDRVSVRAVPHIRAVAAEPKHGADLLTPLLAGLLSREHREIGSGFPPAADDADLLIVAGRSGTGGDDTVPLALDAGRWPAPICTASPSAPGGSSGLGWLGSVPVILLPGEPLACLAAFVFVAARLIRRMSGHAEPPTRNATLSRKIVSVVGFIDLARVAFRDGMAEPLGAIETGRPRRRRPFRWVRRRAGGVRGLPRRQHRRINPSLAGAMTELLARLRQAANQEQFLDVVSRDEAEARFRVHLLSCPARRTDGFARRLPRPRPRPRNRRAGRCSRLRPFRRGRFRPACRRHRRLRATTHRNGFASMPRSSAPPSLPALGVAAGTATLIATGGMLPRGADAVVMVEHTEIAPGPDGAIFIEITRHASPGQFIAAAGSDLARGGNGAAGRHRPDLARDRHAGRRRARRSVGLAPAGRRHPLDRRRTGGARCESIRTGQVYDSNAAVLEAGVTELGGMPVCLGILPDDEDALAAGLERALAVGDVVLAVGWHLQGRGRYRASRGGAAGESGCGGPRRRAQARQAAVPRCDRRKAGGDPAGVSDLGDLHLP